MMMSRRATPIGRVILLIVSTVIALPGVHACSSTSETTTRENNLASEKTMPTLITITTTSTSTISTTINSATTTATIPTTTMTMTTMTSTTSTTTTTSMTSTTTTTKATTTTTIITTNQMVCNGNPQWIDDDICDDQNNNDKCDWDGGDCCGTSDDVHQYLYCDACECLDEDLCTLNNPCSEDEGDCDSNNECKTNLICDITNSCPTYLGFASEVNCCSNISISGCKSFIIFMLKKYLLPTIVIPHLMHF